MPERSPGSRCAACQAHDVQIQVGDRFGRPQFRRSEGLLEFDRVPPQPQHARWGALLVLGVALAFALLGFRLAGAAFTPSSMQGFVAGTVLGGLAAIALAPHLLPLAFASALVARRQALELGRWTPNGWRIHHRIAAEAVQRFAVRSTPRGYGLLAQLRDGRELWLAADLTEPDDASRLANALRELLQVSANEPPHVGARRLEPEAVPLPSSLALQRTSRGLQARLPGLFGARVDADDDGLRLHRAFRRPETLLADDLTSIDAEEMIERPGAAPRYRLVANLRRGRRILVDALPDRAPALFLRNELSRVMRLERS